ncbi:tyrosyl-DNA phosphodiesterase 1 [Aristolochia californica]|uniref:tyrosyl-DNA phosphodiesterase 1 n=1 Tax=Aristolochia californica TaxID=171875 RepID=UPI0035DFA815
MAESRPKIGFLVPLRNSQEEDEPSSIPVFKGPNVLGRSDLSLLDKRVSRKHVSFNTSADGSIEMVVEGSNPVIVQSGLERKRLNCHDKATICHGDIIEMIPGNFSYKYKTLESEKHESPEKHSEERTTLKRKRQILDDEALAQSLQEEFWTNNDVPVTANRDSSNPVDLALSCDQLEPICHFNVPKEKISFTFQLLQVQGIPTWANTSSVSIGDVIQGNVLMAVLSNYMVDIDWLMSACPVLRKVPHVLVIHGESGHSLEQMKEKKPQNWILHKPPLPISYGTHHSKAMFLVYPHGIRVVVHTANLIYVDWNNKSQGLWMQDFPLKDETNLQGRCYFETDLVEYLSALKWAEFSVKHPDFGNVSINASFFKKFDYSSAMVRLIASVPGYHSGSNLKKWGHMKLRDVLQDCSFGNEFIRSPLVYQFSSLGSLDEKWMAEFASSTSSGLSDDKSPLGLGKAQIIWPTVEDVRCSLEGYAAGSCIPSPQKNVEKDFLKKYWAKWKAKHTGRCRAMPHIKTYTRYNGQNLAWFLLTSANLSKAAWGALQKNNSQLMIRSYELGVLFLPSTVRGQSPGFSCTDNGGSSQGASKQLGTSEGSKVKLVTLCWQGNGSTNSSPEVIKLPVPYQLPPLPYASEDVPWSWDKRYLKKDVHGQIWPPRS